MALPKISNPIFELTLPSTGQSVKYRPFLVKEQKILLLAMESGDQKATLLAIKQIINNCAIDPIDVDKLPTFDVEYFFIRLRAKSIGEVVDLRMRHPTGFNSKEVECDNVTIVPVNLLDIEIERAIDHSDKIVIDEEAGIGVKMKYPTIAMATENEDKPDMSQMDNAITAIINTIDYIYDKDNVYKKEDSTKEELVEFVEGLSQEQFIKLTNFFATMPKVKKSIKWKCSKCAEEDSMSLEGMQSFFAL